MSEQPKSLADLKRYMMMEGCSAGASMEPMHDGAYVRFSDVEALVASITNKNKSAPSFEIGDECSFCGMKGYEKRKDGEACKYCDPI